jgi:hypothetical protein
MDMERDLKLTVVLGIALTIAGCGAQSPAAGNGGSGGSGGSSGIGGGEGGMAGQDGRGGQSGEPGTPALDPLGAMPAYAVISSDFSSTSIAMLDGRFEIIEESWLNSGTTYPGLVATLSGDVVLPTRQQGDGTFGVIDRFLTDVITQFFVPSGNLNGQARTQGDTGDSGFSSNPQDIIFIDAQSAWVTRYEPNLDPNAAPENQGSDLYEINPKDWSTTGARIDLSTLNTIEMVEDAPVEVFARPSRGVLIDSTILVGLDRISAAFDAAGTGIVALVNIEDKSITSVELTGLKNCGRVVAVPGEANKATVACTGFSNPFGDEAQIRATAGVAMLDVQPEGVAVERMWRASDDAGSPIAVSGMIALDAEHVLAVAHGNFVDTTDVLYDINLTDGAVLPVLTSPGSFTIGVSAYDADRGMLHVPDAARNAVIELEENADGFTETGSTEIAPNLGLPPTQVYVLN